MLREKSDTQSVTQTQWKERESEQVSIESLSELTGFPVEFIRKELLIDSDQLSMGELRESMVRYLETSFIDQE